MLVILERWIKAITRQVFGRRSQALVRWVLPQSTHTHTSKPNTGNIMNEESIVCRMSSWHSLWQVASPSKANSTVAVRWQISSGF